MTRKNILKNISAILFLFIIFYVGISSIKNNLKNIYSVYNNNENISGFIDGLDNEYENLLDFNSKGLLNRGFYINLNGKMANILNQREMNERVKLNNGNLTYLEFLEENIDYVAGNITSLHKNQTKNNKHFLFVLTPNQLSEDQNLLPEYFVNEDNTNHYSNKVLSKLRESNVPFLDLRKRMKQDKMANKDYFFKTDHHWKPELGFWAYSQIVNQLETDGYTSKIDQKFNNFNDFYIDKYENWFLGSAGKRTGIYFNGVDDFSIIYPKFDTNINFSIPQSNLDLYGRFEDVVLDLNANVKDYFNKNPYVVYGHGDRGLIEYRNDDAPLSEKFLLIGDSFSNVPFSYFSLISKEVYQIDMRHFHKNFEEFYDVLNPDIIILMINPSGLNTPNIMHKFYDN